MKRFPFPSFTAPSGVVLAWLFLAGTACGQPHVPKEEGQVLERLRSAPLDPVARELRELRAQLGKAPANLAVAAQFARRCIEKSRAEADPRYLGRAQAALAPWWDDPKAPADALVLRATLKQSQHDFTNALSDLSLALESDPANSQAWLTRVTVLSVLGRYDEARQACVRLMGRMPLLVATTAAASIASLNGEALRSCQLLRQVLERSPAATAGEKLWALSLLAESYARLDLPMEAEYAFKQALELGQRDAYLLGAYADFLLDQNRPKEVETLLREETRADALLLRLVLAESVLTPDGSSFKRHVQTLQARFEASRLRSDMVHQREEARFVLYVLKQPQEALRLALGNWQVQREPADARILVEAALGAKAPAAALPARQFVERNHLEDARLKNLLAQVN